MVTKELVKQKLFTKTKKINTALIRRAGFTQTPIYQAIDEYTNNIAGSISEKIYCFLNDITHPVKCSGCDNKVIFKTFQTGYTKFCSNKCARKIIKWGDSSKKSRDNYKHIVENFLRYYQTNQYTKIVATDLKHWIKNRVTRNSANLIYRSDYTEHKDVLSSVLERTNYLPIKTPFNWSERFYHIINDIFSPVLNKYDPSKLAVYENINIGYRHIYKKGNDTLLPPRGWNSHYKDIQTHLAKEGFVVQNVEQLKNLNKNKIDLFCTKCNKVCTGNLRNGRWKVFFCYNCYGDPCSSYQEKTVVNFIKSIYAGEIIENYTLENKELDIFIPEFRLGIEFNGLIWHSFGTSYPNNYEKEKYEKERLLRKTYFFNSHNIQVLHIFSHEWEDECKREIWQSIIKNKLNFSQKYYARVCSVQEISPTDKNIFLQQNHIQGTDKSKISLGLFFNKELLSVMTFSHPRFTKKLNIDYELVRFCNKKNITVIGGASKILSYFERKYNPKGIVSYADLRRGQGNMYLKLGFNFNHVTLPNYFYFYGKYIIKRYCTQKKLLSRLLEGGYNPKLSEAKNMFKNGYRRVWDCGNNVYIKSNLYTRNK